MDRLPPGLTAYQIRALSMHYVDDKSLDEIAEELGVSRSSVSRLIRRGRRHLETAGLSLPAPIDRPKMIYVDPSLLDKGTMR